MLTLKELENRMYLDKTCMYFTYNLRNEKKEVLQRFEFFRSAENENQWNMRVIIERTRDADSQVYNFNYIMPNSKAPLSLICAVGLRYFELYLKEEIQTKSDYDFLISDVIRGM